MIRGKVLASGEAVIALKVRGLNGLIGQIEMMVDTGFNDAPTLPPEVIEKLQLPFRHEANYTLADGVKSAARIFGGDIEWGGIWRELLVVEIEGGALLGMAMMGGCNLSIDVVDGEV